jgi:hypothetical protein
VHDEINHSESAPSYNPLEQQFMTPMIPNFRSEKKYSEEDILLLIKFIVKEFAKIVQKWSFTQSSPFSMFGANNNQMQPNLNQLLLSLLMNRDNMMKQQETLAQNLMQQINPKILLDMLNQSKSQSGYSTPMTPYANNMASSVPAPFFANRDPEPKENIDDLKTPDLDRKEAKDEVDTIQSSEDKKSRKRSLSDDTLSPSRKINLEQAYSILNKNASLSSLLKSFSSSV